mmetsp:Transcript_128295/g.369463  ORF Transcript_128295/g.369463 Transcript_128295/m.369463 type:complete len:743 (-) Transcript_128295:437-2665(-)
MTTARACSASDLRLPVAEAGLRDVVPTMSLLDTICFDTLESVALWNCTCGHGYFTVDNECLPCPLGWLCPARLHMDDGKSGKIADTIHHRVSNGYWLEPGESSHLMFKCVDLRSCWWTTLVDLWNASSHHACQHAVGSGTLVGVHFISHCSAKSGSVGLGSEDGCSDNRDDFLCARCRLGYFKDHIGNCRPCGEGFARFFPATLRITLETVFLFGFYKFLNRPSGGKFMATTMISSAGAAVVDAAQQFVYLASLNVISVQSLEEAMLEFAKKLPTFPPVECAWANHGMVVYPFSVLWPAYLACILGALRSFFACTAPFRVRIPQRVPCPYGRVRTVFDGFLADIHTFHMENDKCINTFGFIIFAMFVSVVKTSFDFLLVTDHASLVSPTSLGRSTSHETVVSLHSYPHVRMPSPDWLVMLPFGLFGASFSITFFAYHVWFVYRAPRVFGQSASFRIKHKYFYAKFREDRYYYGLVVIGKGLTLMLIAQGQQTSSHRAVSFFIPQVTIFVNIGTLWVLTLYRPYKCPLNTVLEICLTGLLIVLVVMSIERNPTSQLGEYGADLILLFALAGISVPFFLHFAVLLCRRKSRLSVACSATGELHELWCRVARLRPDTLASVMGTLSPSELESLSEAIHLMKDILYDITSPAIDGGMTRDCQCQNNTKDVGHRDLQIDPIARPDERRCTKSEQAILAHCEPQHPRLMDLATQAAGSEFIILSHQAEDTSFGNDRGDACMRVRRASV